MVKLSLWNKFLQMPVSKFLLYVMIYVIISRLFFLHGSYRYNHIPREEIEQNLFKVLLSNLPRKEKPDCDYMHILQSKDTILPHDIPKKLKNFTAKGIINGTYVPEHCNPIFSVALLVTYRNRKSQLDIFIPYIHDFLRKQDIHYRIYLIEQRDSSPWNKGVLYNLGARQALADGFPCLVLHDVDLLPLDTATLYACTNLPRHLSAAVDKFRFVLPYEELVGGVLAIRTDQFVELNGFSNKYRGWGGEDDDFTARILAQDLSVLRFAPEMSRYTMILHHQEPKNKERKRIMAENKIHFKEDGLNSVHYQSVQITNTELYTAVLVQL